MVYNASSLLATKRYRANHLEKVREYDAMLHKKRYENDEEYRLAKQAQMRAYRLRLKQEKIDAGIPIKKRGRQPKSTNVTPNVSPL